jgi:hypothetical protein
MTARGGRRSRVRQGRLSGVVGWHLSTFRRGLVEFNRNSSIVNQDRDRVPVASGIEAQAQIAELPTIHGERGIPSLPRLGGGAAPTTTRAHSNSGTHDSLSLLTLTRNPPIWSTKRNGLEGITDAWILLFDDDYHGRSGPAGSSAYRRSAGDDGRIWCPAAHSAVLSCHKKGIAATCAHW